MLTPAHVLVEGKPFWSWPDGKMLPVVAGGADEPATDKPDPKAENKPEPETDKGDLGPNGEKALREERDARKAAEKAAKAAADELATLKAATATDAEKAIAKAKEEGKAEALKTANERLLKAEIKSAAAGRLADPNDAVRLLDPDDFTNAEGEVEEAKLKKAIDELLKDKPYLAGKKSAGDGGGGPRGKDAGPSMDDWLRSQARR